MCALVKNPRVRVFPAEEVTSIDREAEVDPREVGLDPEAIDAIWKATVGHYATGLQPAIAICIRRRGKVVMRRAIGHLRGNVPGQPGPLVPVRHDSLFNLYSCSKAITAMMVHLLDQRGLIHLDDAVADYIPEFGRYGKEAITIRQVLTHRAGIPALPGAQFQLSMLHEPGKVIELLSEARLLSVPGRTLAYHALTGGFLLGEIIERVTGRDLRRFLHDEVVVPWGLKTFNYGVPAGRVGDVGENVQTGPLLAPFSWLFARSIGADIETAIAYANDPLFATAIVPSGNVIATADDACLFFEGLLRGGELNGVRVFDRRTMRRAVAEQSFLEVDSSLGIPVRYSMGFMLGGEWFSPYGAETTQAFGHVGFSNVVVWADPERDLSVAYLNTGKPFLTLDQLAWLNVTRVISRVCGRP